MSININLCPNFYLTPPLGYPVRLWIGGETMLEGFLPKRVTAIAADVYTESGSADVHMGIYAAPTTVDGDDGALVQQEDLLGLTNVPQTLTLTIDTEENPEPACYVLRLWVEGLDGSRGVQVTKVIAS